MRSKEWILYLFVSISFYQCSVTQYRVIEEQIDRTTSNDFLSTREEGECLAKCLIPDILEIRSKEFVVFTGDETLEDVDLENRRIIVKQKRNEWIKKRATKNCLSPNPNDCIVWCIVEEPEEVERIEILVDTTQSKNYEIRTIEYEVFKQKGGFTEWRPVLCKEDLTESIIAQIQNSLMELGYYDGVITESMDAETKSGLVTFQKDYHLPVGNLDLETLGVLGVTLD